MKKEKRMFNFMGQRKIAAVFSIILLMVSIGSLFVNNLQLGLDFSGGTLVEIELEKPYPLESIREALEANDFKNAIVVHFGAETDVLIRLASDANDDAIGENVSALINKQTNQTVKVLRVEFVGPQVGDDLRDQGGLALLTAFAMIMLYVGFRFQLKFAVGAVSDLIHDVIIVVGMFSLFQWDFDLTVLAAILAVIGYSLNDTIVIGDRIRENFHRLRKGTAEEIINISINEVLSRTVVTSLTTVLVLLALLFVGGDAIEGFAKALLIGVGVGTYSSIYVSANLLVALKLKREDMIPPEKEGEEMESFI